MVHQSNNTAAALLLLLLSPNSPRTFCHGIPVLERNQKKICYKSPGSYWSRHNLTCSLLKAMLDINLLTLYDEIVLFLLVALHFFYPPQELFPNFPRYC